jgi:surface antigen
MTIPMLRRFGFIPLCLTLVFGLIALPGTASANCSPTSTNGILGGLGGAVVGGLLGSTIGGGSGKTIATIGGALAGGLIGNNLMSQLNCQDQGYLGNSTERSLDTGQPVSWKNPDSGTYGTVTPTRTYNSDLCQYCREYQQTVYIDGKPQKGYGTACRQPDGSWKIVS